MIQVLIRLTQLKILHFIKVNIPISLTKKITHAEPVNYLLYLLTVIIPAVKLLLFLAVKLLLFSSTGEDTLSS